MSTSGGYTLAGTYNDTTMHDPRRIGHNAYISDQSTFSEALRNLRSAHDPLYLNVVTMQNHMPYGGKE